MMHQSEFDAANVALSRAADKRKSLINIHNNRYAATLIDLHLQSLASYQQPLLSSAAVPWWRHSSIGCDHTAIIKCSINFLNLGSVAVIHQ